MMAAGIPFTVFASSKARFSWSKSFPSATLITWKLKASNFLSMGYGEQTSCNSSVNLKSVVIHDHDQVVQLSGSGKHGCLPDLSFLDLSISQKGIYPVILARPFLRPEPYRQLRKFPVQENRWTYLRPGCASYPDVPADRNPDDAVSSRSSFGKYPLSASAE